MTGYSPEGFAFQLLPNGHVKVTGIRFPPNGVLEIPAVVNDRPVDVIGESAFEGLGGFHTLLLPLGLRIIERKAFMGCGDLRSVHFGAGLRQLGFCSFARCGSLLRADLPEGLHQLDMKAFWDCPSLVSATIPLSLTQLASNPFGCCPALTDLRCAPGHPVFTVRDGMLINRLTGVLVCCPASRVGLCRVPDGIIAVGIEAFMGCVLLTHIQLPRGLVYLWHWAFCQCSGLICLETPETLLHIGVGAFLGCIALSHVWLSDGLLAIGGQAFGNCPSLISVRLPATLEHIDDGAFPYAPTLCISVEQGSYAEKYCRERGLPCELRPGSRR